MDGRLVSKAPSPEAAADAVDAQAAVWLVRVQSADGGPELRAQLQGWLDRDPAHKAAFDRASAIWDGLGSVAARRAPSVAPRVVASLAVCLAVALGVFGWMQRAPTYETGVGGQRVVQLQDGSVVTLNTDTRLVVAFEAEQRQVRLERGEAIFDVAHDASRPFSVEADGRRVRALGTTFVVRRDPRNLQVTLLSGRVRVSGGPVDRPPVLLEPGERVSLFGGDVRLDYPHLDQLTAWRQGDLVLDQTPLTTAVAEMNRYSEVRIELDPAAAKGARLSGVFKTGDSRDFARTVGALYGLTVRSHPGRLVISKPAA